MVQVVAFDIGDGHKAVYTVNNEYELERIRRRLLKKYGKANIKPPDVNDVLRKYGLSEYELKRLVSESKSQPELIMKLRRKLTGSTKYDPRYHDVEVLATKMFESKEFRGAPFEGDIKKQLESLKKSLIVRNEKGWVVENGQLKPKLETNTGIKTVPAPKPPEKPPEPVHVKTTIAEPKKKSVSGLLVLGLVGAGILYKLIKKR